jgi:protein SCO1/2
MLHPEALEGTKVTMVARRRVLAALFAPWPVSARPASLPTIGEAPTFSLTDQTARKLSLADLRGKVLAVSFVFTTCSDTCPVVTAKLAEIRRRLGADFGRRVHFASISVDPLTDTPERLRAYAAKFGADGPGWSFLTGKPADVDDVVRGFGAYARRVNQGAVDHLNLTSLVDRKGQLRVQYLGYRFEVGEMLTDLRTLLDE